MWLYILIGIFTLLIAFVGFLYWINKPLITRRFENIARPDILQHLAVLRSAEDGCTLVLRDHATNFKITISTVNRNRSNVNLDIKLFAPAMGQKEYEQLREMYGDYSYESSFSRTRHDYYFRFFFRLAHADIECRTYHMLCLLWSYLGQPAFHKFKFHVEYEYQDWQGPYKETPVEWANLPTVLDHIRTGVNGFHFILKCKPSNLQLILLRQKEQAGNLFFDVQIIYGELIPAEGGIESIIGDEFRAPGRSVLQADGFTVIPCMAPIDDAKEQALLFIKGIIDAYAFSEEQTLEYLIEGDYQGIRWLEESRKSLVEQGKAETPVGKAMLRHHEKKERELRKKELNSP